MALAELQDKYIPKEYTFYARHYHHVIYSIMGLICLLAIAVGVLLYQVFHRPLPSFTAELASGARMELAPFETPNLLPDTILRWASKAATAAYTFDFANYRAQIIAARTYFTQDGWNDYTSSLTGLINTIEQNQLFVNGVVAGAPVIANEGPLPGQDYVWRIQIPYLVTYWGTIAPVVRTYLVILTVVRVPTATNPQGIGIDRFVMVQR